ncbi:hypothetical protein WJX72_004731 [[Myrmecia] bisecta]|uniref:Acid phosphatase n=1 Tax=[Myrmecia] bisecta TaxID=41462 RepID=A0AAW1R5I9_9CHLO
MGQACLPLVLLICWLFSTAAQPADDLGPVLAPINNAVPPSIAMAAGFGKTVSLPCLDGCTEPDYLVPNKTVTTEGGVGNPLLSCRQQIQGYLISKNLTTMAALLQLPNVTNPVSLLDLVYARAHKDPEFDVTLLAPTDAAFAALNGSFGAVLLDGSLLVNTAPKADQLLAVLAYHVLENSYGLVADLLNAPYIASLLADAVGTAGSAVPANITISQPANQGPAILKGASGTAKLGEGTALSTCNIAILPIDAVLLPTTSAADLATFGTFFQRDTAAQTPDTSRASSTFTTAIAEHAQRPGWALLQRLRRNVNSRGRQLIDLLSGTPGNAGPASVGSEDLPRLDATYTISGQPKPNPLIDTRSDPNQPEQVHLAYLGANPAGVSGYYVSFAYGKNTRSDTLRSAKDCPIRESCQTEKNDRCVTTNGQQTCFSARWTVEYQRSGGSLHTGNCIETSYRQLYGDNEINYASNPFVHCRMDEISTLAEKYTYRIMAEGKALLTSTFVTPPNKGQLQPGDKFNPVAMGAIGDHGQTFDSVRSRDLLAELANGQIVLHMGDLSYADTYGYNNGKPGPFPLRTDSYFRMMSGLFSTTPLMATPGNHEFEGPQPGTGSVFKSYRTRLVNPAATFGNLPPVGASNNLLYYSFDYAGVHVVSMAAYNNRVPARDASDFTDQLTWLQADLQGFSRAKTPWLVVFFHAPWYNSYVSHHDEGEPMRKAFEAMFFKYGVDLVLTGHVHAYERTYPVYDYRRNACGPTHVVMGNGGNRETLSGCCTRFYIYDDAAGTSTGQQCSQPHQFDPSHPVWKAGDADTTNQPACKQPIWSAYREPSYGMATLLFKSDTELVFSFHRNQDHHDVAADTVTLTRDPTCKNKFTPGAQANPQDTRVPSG